MVATRRTRSTAAEAQLSAPSSPTKVQQTHLSPRKTRSGRARVTKIDDAAKPSTVVATKKAVKPNKPSVPAKKRGRPAKGATKRQPIASHIDDDDNSAGEEEDMSKARIPLMEMCMEESINSSQAASPQKSPVKPHTPLASPKKLVVATPKLTVYQSPVSSDEKIEEQQLPAWHTNELCEEIEQRSQENPAEEEQEQLDLQHEAIQQHSSSIAPVEEIKPHREEQLKAQFLDHTTSPNVAHQPDLVDSYLKDSQSLMMDMFKTVETEISADLPLLIDSSLPTLIAESQIASVVEPTQDPNLLRHDAEGEYDTVGPNATLESPDIDETSIHLTSAVIASGETPDTPIKAILQDEAGLTALEPGLDSADEIDHLHLDPELLKTPLPRKAPISVETSNKHIAISKNFLVQTPEIFELDTTTWPSVLPRSSTAVVAATPLRISLPAKVLATLEAPVTPTTVWIDGLEVPLPPDDWSPTPSNKDLELSPSGFEADPCAHKTPVALPPTTSIDQAFSCSPDVEVETRQSQASLGILQSAVGPTELLESAEAGPANVCQTAGVLSNLTPDLLSYGSSARLHTASEKPQVGSLEDHELRSGIPEVYEVIELDDDSLVESFGMDLDVASSAVLEQAAQPAAAPREDEHPISPIAEFSDDLSSDDEQEDFLCVSHLAHVDEVEKLTRRASDVAMASQRHSPQHADQVIANESPLISFLEDSVGSPSALAHHEVQLHDTIPDQAFEYRFSPAAGTKETELQPLDITTKTPDEELSFVGGSPSKFRASPIEVADSISPKVQQISSYESVTDVEPLSPVKNSRSREALTHSQKCSSRRQSRRQSYMTATKSAVREKELEFQQRQEAQENADMQLVAELEAPDVLIQEMPGSVERRRSKRRSNSAGHQTPLSTDQELRVLKDRSSISTEDVVQTDNSSYGPNSRSSISAVKIQALFRGWRARRQLATGLAQDSTISAGATSTSPRAEGEMDQVLPVGDDINGRPSSKEGDPNDVLTDFLSKWQTKKAQKLQSEEEDSQQQKVVTIPSTPRRTEAGVFSPIKSDKKPLVFITAVPSSLQKSRKTTSRTSRSRLPAPRIANLPINMDVDDDKDLRHSESTSTSSSPSSLLARATEERIRKRKDRDATSAEEVRKRPRLVKHASLPTLAATSNNARPGTRRSQTTSIPLLAATRILAPTTPKKLNHLTPAEVTKTTKNFTMMNRLYRCDFDRIVVRKDIPRPPSPTAKIQSKMAANARAKRRRLMKDKGFTLGAGDEDDYVPIHITPTRKAVKWEETLETDLFSLTRTSPSTVRSADQVLPCIGPSSLDDYGNIEVNAPLTPELGKAPKVRITKVLYKGEQDD